MTVRELLSLADAAKPNELGDDLKLRWINDVEGRIECEIHKRPISEFKSVLGEDDVLCVPDSHSGLYLPYLLSMIAFAGADYEAYSRASVDFETALHAYAKFYIRNK